MGGRVRTQYTPTSQQWRAYQQLFDYFNRALFGDELPAVILNFSRKNGHNLGFFSPERWSHDPSGAAAHEISLNPRIVREQRPVEVAQTLVHEMCHLWQQVGGMPSRGGYHNREWGTKMKAVGLYPSSTGTPGGSETGQQMADYVIEGGLFERAWNTCTIRLPWGSFEPTGTGVRVRRNKTKYRCPCGHNVWGKPDMDIVCGDCDGRFESIG